MSSVQTAVQTDRRHMQTRLCTNCITPLYIAARLLRYTCIPLHNSCTILVYDCTAPAALYLAAHQLHYTCIWLHTSCTVLVSGCTPDALHLYLAAHQLHYTCIWLHTSCTTPAYGCTAAAYMLYIVTSILHPVLPTHSVTMHEAVHAHAHGMGV